MRKDSLRECVLAFGRGIEPPPSVTVSEWADEHRILPRTSAEPGPWRTARTPYLREIMDRLSPQDPCETVVIMKGAQLGLTSVAENWVGHSVHFDPSPMMLVQPTWNTARDYARDRVNPLVGATPELQKLVTEQRSRKGGSNTPRRPWSRWNCSRRSFRSWPTRRNSSNWPGASAIWPSAWRRFGGMTPRTTRR